MHNLSQHVLTSLRSTGVAASATSTDWNDAALDMRGYEAVRYIVGVESTSTGRPNLHAEMSATSSDLGTWLDVNISAAYLTSGFTESQAMGVLITDVFRPSYRWVRLYVDRATTGETIHFAIAEQYRPDLAPPTFSTAVNICDETVCVGTSGTATGST